MPSALPWIFIFPTKTHAATYSPLLQQRCGAGTSGCLGHVGQVWLSRCERHKPEALVFISSHPGSSFALSEADRTLVLLPSPQNLKSK